MRKKQQVTEKRVEPVAILPKKPEKKVVDSWRPICRFNAYDFNEVTGRFGDASNKVELQQEATTKVLRCVVVR